MSTESLFGGPAVGFDQPFEMLLACHERVQQRLDLLARLETHLNAHGSDQQAREAAADVLRYFDLAAPHHHEDEERHVIPRLRLLNHAALANRIQADHREMHSGWLLVRPSLLAICNGESTQLAPTWRAWATLYGDHIRCEESDVFPLSKMLAENELAAMGAEMATRRQRNDWS